MAECIVTGGLGFIGKNYAASLVDQYDKIYIIDKVTRVSDMPYFEQHLAGHMSLLRMDIRDFKFADFPEIGPVIDIVNFAAESHVDESFRNSIEFSRNNLVATHYFLDELLACQREYRFLHISTDEVYGETLDGAADEDAPFNPTNPYSASKAAADILVQTYHRCFDLEAVIIRANNLFGPRQHVEKLIPKTIYRFANGEPMNIHGDGTQLRHFLHVDDFNQALKLLFAKWDEARGKSFNIASDDELTVRDVVTRIAEHMDVDTRQMIEFGSDRPFNDRRYMIDDSRIRALGWAPTVNFSSALKELCSAKDFNTDR